MFTSKLLHGLWVVVPRRSNAIEAEVDYLDLLERPNLSVMFCRPTTFEQAPRPRPSAGTGQLAKKAKCFITPLKQTREKTILP
jgi:hypothetical protein